MYSSHRFSSRVFLLRTGAQASSLAIRRVGGQQPGRLRSSLTRSLSLPVLTSSSKSARFPQHGLHDPNLSALAAIDIRREIE
jgi:hypothetical protein